MSLDENLVLQRVDKMILDLPDHESLVIRTEGNVVHCGPHGLGVLDAFAGPTTIQAAMAHLKGRARGVQDWVDMIATINSLHEMGVLVEPDQVLGKRRAEPLGVDISAYHITMLDDSDRTERFLAAIAATVKEGDVVVDIGTGTGILAMAAARAGARRVFAIEAGEIGTVAEALFEANGYGDRIELVRGWSTQVDLPERADVLVSEMIGAHPLGERVLEVTRDAYQRHLKEGAATVPSRVRIFGLPIPQPVVGIGKTWFTPDALSRWSSSYGFEFGPLEKATEHDVAFFNMLDATVKDLGTLGPPVLFGEIDLKVSRELVFEATANTVLDTEGEVGAIAIYFELDLADEIVLTNDPARAGGTNHWADPVGVFSQPIAVVPGDELEVTYRYGGMEHGLTCRKV